jgi:protein SCO1/2
VAKALATLVILALSTPQAAAGQAGEDAGDIGGPFTLTDHTGRQVSDTDFRGQYMLIFFGYTFCPDVCPLGLANMAAILDLLGDDAEQIQPLFITLDPERDGAKELGAFVTAFHPELVGLTGTQEEIADVAEAYQVLYYKVAHPSGTYFINHSAAVYLMAPDGAFIGSLDHDAPPEAATEAVRREVRQDVIKLSAPNEREVED